MRERVVLILDGIKGGSLPGFPCPSRSLSRTTVGSFGRMTQLRKVCERFSFALGARHFRVSPLWKIHTIAAWFQISSEIYRYVYTCTVYGVGWSESWESFERFESLKFLRGFFSFSFFLRKQRCYTKFYMNELFIYIKWLTWYMRRNEFFMERRY